MGRLNWSGTTIAYDGRYVASDTAITCGEYTRPTALRKIHPVELGDRRILVGMAGTSALFEPFIRWYLSGANAKLHRELFTPHNSNGDGFCGWAIICDPKGKIPPQVEEYNSGMPFRVIIPVPGTIGAGQDIAQALLLDGADAETAVRHAAHVDNSTAGAIEVFDLLEWVWIKQCKKLANLRQLKEVSTQRYEIED